MPTSRSGDKSCIRHITKRPRCSIVNFTRIHYDSVVTFYDFLVGNGKWNEGNMLCSCLFSVKDTSSTLSQYQIS